MANPSDRSRSDSKDWLRVRGRSKSVTNFKNSATYQKFLFFERASAGSAHVSPRPNVRPNVSQKKSKDLCGNSQSYFGAQDSHSSSETHPIVHTSETHSIFPTRETHPIVPTRETHPIVHRSRNSSPKLVSSGDDVTTPDSFRAIHLRSATGRATQRFGLGSGTGSGTGRASHMKFAYGRLNRDQLPAGHTPNVEVPATRSKMVVTATRSKMVVTATRSMPISENRSRHRSEPRHVQDTDQLTQYEVQLDGCSTYPADWASGFQSPPTSIKSDSPPKDRVKTSNENRREGLEHSTFTEVIRHTSTNTKSSSSPSDTQEELTLSSNSDSQDVPTSFSHMDTQDVPISSSHSDTQDVPTFKQSLPARNQSLLHVIPGYFSLQSRRCLSSPDVSLLPLNMPINTTSIVISEDDSSVSPDSQNQHLTISGSPECQSDCSIDIFLSRSNSPGAFSDSLAKECFDRCSCTSCPPSRNHLQLTSCQSPVSEPTDCCKSLSHSLSEFTRQKSIASIHLTSSVSVSNVDFAREKCRKIHVIKTAHSTPILPLESSPRLVDEWLSSVVKLQRERRASEQWAFPEDDPSTYFSDLPKSGENRTGNIHTKVDSDDVTATPGFNNLESEGKQWSSTGTNTDISLNSNDVESRSSTSNSPDLLFYSNDSPNKTKPGGPVSRYTRTKPLPNMCCPNCCVFHNDVQCSHVHLNNAYQQMENVLPTFTDTRQPSPRLPRHDPPSVPRHVPPSVPRHVPPSVPRHVPQSHITSRVERENISNPLSLSLDGDGPDSLSLDADGPGIMICITGEEGEAPDRAALSSTLPDGRTHPLRDAIREVGASPHYIFPCSASGLEDESQGSYCQQLSPRNSIGSICSTHSNKSSNADSAVDLGPPDDDHDFEFADFLAKHQGRRYSGVSESAETPDCGQMRNDQSLTLGATFSNINEPVFEVPNDVCSHWRRNVASLASPENMSRDLPSYSARPKAPSLNEDFDTLGSAALHGRAGLELRGQQEGADNLSPRRLKCSPLQGLGTATSPSGFRVYKSVDMVKDKFTKEQFQSSLQFSNRAKDQYNRLSPKDHVQALPSIEAIEDDALCPPNGQQGVGQHSYMSTKEKLYQELGKSLQPLIPELIISDHSGPSEISLSHRPSEVELRDLPSYSDRPIFSLGDTDLEMDDSDPPGLFTPISPSPVPTDLDFLQVEGSPMFRSASVSSVSSDWSTCSTCTVMSDTDTEKSGTRPLKQSSWRKIRSFILWSPFIQVFKKHRYPWIQLAGHQGNFHAGEAGSVLKKLDAREQLCFVKLMADKLKDCVPEYRGDVEKNGESYIQLQDLLCTFNHPCVMDVKMGVRTYLEDELQKARKSPSLRKDMYQKMIEIDTTAPTTEENEHKAVTKPRYMQWRDEMSSSVELGFRVEGIKKSDGNSSKDFKKTKTRDNIVDILKSFVGDNETIVEKYIKRLKEIMHTQETSDFFLSHEVIGSSLLFVHDVDDNVGVWMIDFGKTEPLPSGVVINHRNTWQEGNHEDGYLFGLDNLVSIFEEVQTSLKSSAV